MNGKLAHFFATAIAALEEARDKTLEDVLIFERRMGEQKERIQSINREIGELMEARDSLKEMER